jgi:hypothetical protein
MTSVRLLPLTLYASSLTICNFSPLEQDPYAVEVYSHTPFDLGLFQAGADNAGAYPSGYPKYVYILGSSGNSCYACICARTPHPDQIPNPNSGFQTVHALDSNAGMLS